MKQAVGTTTVFKLVLAFTLLFSAFLAVAITYNKAYKLKNETISILEKYEGVNKKSLKIINNYLHNSGYNTRGSCDVGEYGVKDLNKEAYELAKNNERYYYCINYYCTTRSCKVNGNEDIFYKVKLFFDFNLPFFGELTTFKITGDTKAIKLYTRYQKL